MEAAITSAKISSGNTIPLEARPGTAAAMKVTPSSPIPAKPAFDTPEQKAAISTRVHCSAVKSGMDRLQSQNGTESRTAEFRRAGTLKSLHLRVAHFPNSMTTFPLESIEARAIPDVLNRIEMFPIPSTAITPPMSFGSTF